MSSLHIIGLQKHGVPSISVCWSFDSQFNSQPRNKVEEWLVVSEVVVKEVVPVVEVLEVLEDIDEVVVDERVDVIVDVEGELEAVEVEVSELVMVLVEVCELVIVELEVSELVAVDVLLSDEVLVEVEVIVLVSEVVCVVEHTLARPGQHTSMPPTSTQPTSHRHSVAVPIANLQLASLHCSAHCK